LKFVRTFVADLEVEANRYWEWEDAIIEGYAIFDQLRRGGQGTVLIDLETKSMAFRREVAIDIRGALAAMGSASLESGPGTEEQSQETIKKAILDSLELAATDEHLAMLDVAILSPKRVSVEANGAVQQAIWDRKIISFRPTLHRTAGVLNCAVAGLSDPKDS